MDTWKPISDEDFHCLLAEQYRELSDTERAIFDIYRVKPWKAIIRRSVQAGDEYVFVVAETERNGVLYFDDVEYGFNIATIDDAGRILTPGGSQNTLKQAMQQWFPESR